MRYLLIILCLIISSCRPPARSADNEPTASPESNPDYYGYRRDEENPTDEVYYSKNDSGDAVPVQIIRLRSGATFVIIGTDTHGTPIVYTYNAEGWELDGEPK